MSLTYPKPNVDFKNTNELKVGDVILCFCDSSGKTDFIAKGIKKVTGSEYCHAAIYYGDSLIAESRAIDGVKKGKIVKESIDNLVSRYKHIAVLRQPDAWVDSDQVKALQLFIDNVIDTGAKYNFSGIKSFSENKKNHETGIYDKLNAFFNDELSPDLVYKSNYFCSEFVADCFIAVGFIDPSAAILYKSDTYSPGDLSEDPTFGTFYGYISVIKNYQVSESDYYYYETTFEELVNV